MSAPRYPSQWEADVALRDGAAAHVRPIRPDDKDALQAFHKRQSAESIYLRFFAPLRELSKRDLSRFTEVDFVERVALVVTIEDDIIAVGRYDALGDGDAEVAFNVSDQHQGRGLGSVLLEHLADVARESGIRRFVAEVLPQNRKMITVFTEAGYHVKQGYDDGVVNVEFDIHPTEKSLAVAAAREHRAEAKSLRPALAPESVVVIGASRDPQAVGNRLLKNVIEGGFRGPVYAVNPEAFEVAGVASFARLSELPTPAELALVAVPAASVPEVVGDCARAGIKAAIIVSRGFAEVDDGGLRLQNQVVRQARRHGMRVVGPNSLGVINATAEVALNASLAPVLPRAGNLALFSQSGAMSVAVLTAAVRRDLGISSFVSAGNRADVSGNDCMQYWEEDPATRVVGIYLESIGNPRKFSRIARRLSRSKPVIVVKTGGAGFKVPPGHAVRHTSATKTTVKAMFRQAGVISVDNTSDMFDVADLLCHQPLPRGPRVSIVSNSEAMGSLIADLLVDRDLRATVDSSLNVHSPLADFEATFERHLSSDEVDIVFANVVTPISTPLAPIAKALARAAAKHPDTMVLSCFIGPENVNPSLSTGSVGVIRDQDLQATYPTDAGRVVVPHFDSPEAAAKALVAASRYAAWREKPLGERVYFDDTDRPRARSIIDRELSRDPEVPLGQRRELDAETVRELLACYGIDVWEAREARTADEAVAAAEHLGYPVVLKSASARYRHRADMGGVRLDIENADELRRAVAVMQRNLGQVTEAPFEVQRMAPLGTACVVRTEEDPLFGPVVSFGLAGDAINLLDDVAQRIAPLSTEDVASMVRSVRAAPKLFGYGGLPAVDVPALENLIARASQFADDVPEIASLQLYPVVVAPPGAEVTLAVLTARVSIAGAQRNDLARRALPRLSDG
ncbi:GNAT family N-acetyltransferase [Micrococcales bacterium 31B]|nr:GNAT family N-acetyltransferase [Micrococcales bacterium 31B]